MCLVQWIQIGPATSDMESCQRFEPVSTYCHVLKVAIDPGRPATHVVHVGGAPVGNITSRTRF